MTDASDLKAALDAFNRGDSRRALSLGQTLLLKSLSDPRVHHLIGLCFLRLKQPGSAVKALKQASKLAPQEEAIRIALAQAYAVQGDAIGCAEVLNLSGKRQAKNPALVFEEAKILAEIGFLEEAIEKIRSLLQEDRNHPVLLAQLSTLQREAGLLDDAETSCRTLLSVKEAEPGAWANLANVLFEQNRFPDAEEAAQKALSFSPGFSLALITLGEIQFATGRYEESLNSFEQVKTEIVKARSLDCLAHLERWDAIDQILNARLAESAKDSARLSGLDLRHAAMSAFLAKHLDRQDRHTFAPFPLNRVSVFENLGTSINQTALLDALKEDVRRRRSRWDPSAKTTKNGRQTVGNLFANPTEPMQNLERFIRNALEAYRTKFQSDGSLLGTRWPKQFTLKAWCVELSTGGYQSPHIHPEGWVSGVLYLQIPPLPQGSEGTERSEEGAIEFTLQGDCHPNLKTSEDSYRRHSPKAGDIVLFPSSLFHRTIPFSNPETRICIAFDMVH